MALSSSVVITFLTKFDKKGLQRATKDLKGFDAFLAKSKLVGKAGLAAAAVAGVIALEKLARSSIKAALEQEKLDKSIEQSLRSINRLGELSSIKGFITDLQRTTNITEDQLTPALNSLIVQTGDLEKAQELFKLAVDTSAGAGLDLVAVTDALGKASRGNFRAIGALGLGFNSATAEAVGLGEITEYLALKFGGAATRATETFGGQLDKLKISAGEAQENLGQGFITAAEIIIGSSDAADVFGAKLESLGLNGGYILIAIADKVNKIQDAFAGLSKKISSDPILKFFFGSIDSIPILGGWIDGFRLLAEDGKTIAESSAETLEQTEDQKAAAAKLAALQAKLDKMAKDALNKQKALTKEKLAQQALDKKKAELEAMFDMDRINLQAALSRKLSAEDEARVKILQLLAEGTKEAVDEAQRYADVLKVIQDGKITTEEIEQLAKTWGMTTEAVKLYIMKLFEGNDELRKMLGLMKDLTKEILAVQTMYPTGASMAAFRAYKAGEIASNIPEIAAQQTVYPTGTNVSEYAAFRRGERAMAEGGIVTKPTRALIGEAGAEAVIPLDRMGGMGQRVTINVAGSVISEGQLQSVIQDVLYNLNRTGAVTQLTNLGR